MTETAERRGYYIAGPMRGLKDYNFPAFDSCRDDLLDYGWSPIYNPADNDRRNGFEGIGMEGTENLEVLGFSVADAMSWDLDVILNKAEGIVLLPGWERSTGARLEKHVAETAGLAIYTYHPEQAAFGSRVVHYTGPKEKHEVPAPPFEGFKGTAWAMIDAGQKLGRGAITMKQALEMSAVSESKGPVPSLTAEEIGKLYPDLLDVTEMTTPFTPPADPQGEIAEVIGYMVKELLRVTGDGSSKRRAGLKPSWKTDRDHERAVFSHLMKWKANETIDPDSGTHTLIHGGWRMIAIALQEMHPEWAGE